MLDSAFYIPIFPHSRPVSEPKGNGSITGREAGRSDFKPNDKGVFYRLGMGCHRHDNCFTCTFTDCKFGASQRQDAPFYANRGDGIKVW